MKTGGVKKVTKSASEASEARTKFGLSHFASSERDIFLKWLQINCPITQPAIVSLPSAIQPLSFHAGVPQPYIYYRYLSRYNWLRCQSDLYNKQKRADKQEY